MAILVAHMTSMLTARKSPSWLGVGLELRLGLGLGLGLGFRLKELPLPAHQVGGAKPAAARGHPADQP